MVFKNIVSARINKAAVSLKENWVVRFLLALEVRLTNIKIAGTQIQCSVQLCAFRLKF
jgi:hypothetical protein